MGLRNRSDFDKLGNVYFVTTTIMNYETIFSLGKEYNEILIKSLKYLKTEHNTSLAAYVIMPHHFHMITRFPKDESLVDFMRDFKKFTSTEMRKQLESDNKTEILEKLRLNAVKYPRQVFKLWMDRFDDLIIYTEKTLRTKIDYIHMNPVKAGLVENMNDWVYSSARNYYLGDNSVIDIENIL